MLDRNTWNFLTICKLFTLNYLNVCLLRIIIIILTLSRISHHRYLEAFHWNLSDSKYHQLSTRLCVWMVSSLLPIFNSFSAPYPSLWGPFQAREWQGLLPDIIISTPFWSFSNQRLLMVFHWGYKHVFSRLQDSSQYSSRSW